MQFLNETGVKSLWAKIKGAFLSLNGGTLNGDLKLKQNKIWVQGGSDAGGNVNRMTTTAGMPTDMKYGNGKRGTQIYSNGIAFCDPYNGNNNNDSGWIRHIEETANQGLLEIAVGDDSANEEIHLRYYNTNDQVAYDVLVPRANGTVALTSQIPTKVSQLTNDSGFLTSHQDISGKADKTDLDNYLPSSGGIVANFGVQKAFYTAGYDSNGYCIRGRLRAGQAYYPSCAIFVDMYNKAIHLVQASELLSTEDMATADGWHIELPKNSSSNKFDPSNSIFCIYGGVKYRMNFGKLQSLGVFVKVTS